MTLELLLNLPRETFSQNMVERERERRYVDVKKEDKMQTVPEIGENRICQCGRKGINKISMP